MQLQLNINQDLVGKHNLYLLLIVQHELKGGLKW